MIRGRKTSPPKGMQLKKGYTVRLRGGESTLTAGKKMRRVYYNIKSKNVVKAKTALKKKAKRKSAKRKSPKRRSSKRRSRKRMSRKRTSRRRRRRSRK